MTSSPTRPTRTTCPISSWHVTYILVRILAGMLRGCYEETAPVEFKLKQGNRQLFEQNRHWAGSGKLYLLSLSLSSYKLPIPTDSANETLDWNCVCTSVDNWLSFRWDSAGLWRRTNHRTATVHRSAAANIAQKTRNARQSLVCNPPGIAVSSLLNSDETQNIQGAAKKVAPKVFCRFLGNCLEFCRIFYKFIYWYIII